jgi:AAA domain
MPPNTDHALPVLRVAELPSDEIAERWLVEELWCTGSVGVIGGAPKCAKTWLGLDMALSVATGTPCLGKYAVPEPGPVLIYLAEDALVVVRERVEGIARHRGLDLDQVDVHVITAPLLRLDQERDRTRLWEATRRLRPRLLVLDPLVRLHGIDENRAGDVAELLAYFRSLQRELGLSVLLVHHTRKNPGDGVAAGQGLRGSGDIHAFGDSNLYLQRTKDRLILSSEHRAARASAPVCLELVATDVGMAHLEVTGDLSELSRAKRPNETDRDLKERLLVLLAGGQVSTRTGLRDSLAVKNERLGEMLESLEREGQIRRTPGGWQRLR